MYEAAMKIPNKVLRAAFVARIAHDKQRRKYNGRPYVTHPARVAAMISIHPEANEDLVCAAWLHDVLEDTWVHADLLGMMFGDSVVSLVQEVTNPSKSSDAPRRQRKQQDIEHLKQVSRAAKILKLHDRIDNLQEMENAATDFKKLYSKESLVFAEAIGDVDPSLKKQLLELAESML